MLTPAASTVTIGLAAGYMTKGYCAEKDLARMNALCPSPIPLFIAANR
ncbi:MAG: hypothetical protein PVF97_05025 [Desulfobacterales bacterium]|jgi:hypothetical protein